MLFSLMLVMCSVIYFPCSVIGTSSLRRSAQLKRAFPHLIIEDVVSFYKMVFQKIFGFLRARKLD